MCARPCREAELKVNIKAGKIVNHVKRIYESFTPEQIAARIASDVRPDDCNASVRVVYQTVEDLHKAPPRTLASPHSLCTYRTRNLSASTCSSLQEHVWLVASAFLHPQGVSSTLEMLGASCPPSVLPSGLCSWWRPGPPGRGGRRLSHPELSMLSGARLG